MDVVVVDVIVVVVGITWVIEVLEHKSDGMDVGFQERELGSQTAFSEESEDGQE